MTTCCADCGKDGGVSLKVCKSCMDAKYCNANCQRNHWSTHKTECKIRATELRDKALFKDPPPKEDCPICFLPMPMQLISCMSLPPATISSVPINDFANANERLAYYKNMQLYYPCCGKSFCKGCVYSIIHSGNDKCPFCNSERGTKTEEERVEELMKRVEAQDAASICMLAGYYLQGTRGFQQDYTKAMELYARAADLGCSKGLSYLANIYHEEGNLKKAKFHYEAAAMAGDEVARNNIASIEAQSGNMERAVKHWTIAASAGDFGAMNELIIEFKKGRVNRESMYSTLAAYNISCAEMRSEARDAAIEATITETI